MVLASQIDLKTLIVTFKRSGKSYTLRGDENSDIGIIPRFARDLLTLIENSDFTLHLSIIQIYKQWMFDLLRSNNDPGVLIILI